jgi:TonB-linked SusC/RagA family outer membrane protein
MYSLYTKKLWAPPRLMAKLLLIMRLTTVILFIAIIQVSASTYAQKITLSEKNASLIKVFDQISVQSGYDFFVSKALLKNAKKVSINVRNADLETVLKKIFENQPLEFSIQDKSVLVKERERSFLDDVIAAFRAIDVHGRVLDEEGKPLVGATVSLIKIESQGSIENNKPGDFSLTYKGRNAAAVTDANGEFNLKNVDESAMVMVSYTGYTVYRAKAAKEMGTIKMELDGNLKEVNVTVNTGYQSIARERSAGAIAKPDMDILKNRSGSMNVIQRLDGLIPGLTINNSTSPTGNLKSDGRTRGTSVLVRGLTTISDATNRDPLYVVNGVPVTDISTLNPNDIEDITVLKDATSASIWGAKAANGVIVIITKKGSNASNLKINYDGFINFQGKPDLAYQNTLNSNQYIEAAKEIFDPVVNPWASVSLPRIGGQAPVSPHELILYNKSRNLITQAQADEQLNALASQNNLQQVEDLWYRNAALMNHSLSLSGGGNKYSFYGSGSYTSTKDNRPGSNNDSYGLNLRQDFKLNDRIKMYVITDLFNNVSSSKNTGTRPDATFLPYAMFQNPDGSNADMSWLYRVDEVRAGYENKSLVSLIYNPLNEVNTGSTKRNLIKAAVTSGVSVNLFKGLRYEGVFGYSRTQNKTINYLSQDNYSVRSELASFTLAATTVGGQPTYLLPNIGGRNTVTNEFNKDWTVRNQLVYDNNWNDRKHQVTFLVGQEVQEQLFGSNQSVVRGYDPQLMSYGIVDYAKLGAGVAKTVMPNGTTSSSLSADYYKELEKLARITSYYANGGYTYADKYTLNAGVRIDESNLFGKDKSAQNRPVWSTGVAWQAGKENFMQNVNWVNKLVLRGSYGITGNSPDAGVAASKDIFISRMLVFYPGGAGLNLSSPANRALTWETTKNLNIGVDFSLLQNRLSGTVDLYRKKTENLIGNMVLNPFTSFPSTIGNAGDMTNQGIDLNLSSVNLTNGNLRWNTLLTLGFNKNKITSLNRLTPIVVGSDKINQPYVEGYSAFSLFAYTYAGLDAMGDPQIRLTDGTITKKPNSDKPDDVKYMGTFQPKWSGGFSNIFGYKDFSLSVNAVYNLGHVMRRDVNLLYTGRERFFANAEFNGNPNAEFANRWKKAGDEATTNIPGYLSSVSQRRDTEYYRLADINVLDASYIKLRDITLSYSLPKVFTHKINADVVTFRAQLSNVMLWKANDAGIDPEFQNALFGTRSPLSNQHTITFGAHITF